MYVGTTGPLLPAIQNHYHIELFLAFQFIP